MARRVKSSSMTLRDFHDKTPGQAPVGLPSKPSPNGGCVHDTMDVESVESRFSDMSLSPFGGHGNYAHSDGQMSGSPYKANGNPSYAMLGSRDSWGAQRGYERPLSSHTRPMRSDESHDSEFTPPPPPRYNADWIEERAKRTGSRTPDSEGTESSFHYDVRHLPSHDEYSYRNHYVSQTSADTALEPTWKAAGHPVTGLSGQRPKLQLHPRSAPLPADASAQPQPAPAVGGQRPKLQLQPRSKPAEGGGARQSSLFGVARPREDILKERGVDPLAADAGPLPALPAHPAPPPRSVLAAHAPADQIASGWQTVGAKRGQHGYGQGQDLVGSGEDLLLSSTAPARPFHQNGYQPYDNAAYGGYGHPQGRYSYGLESDAVGEGEPGFPGRRGLPTREDLF